MGRERLPARKVNGRPFSRVHATGDITAVLLDRVAKPLFARLGRRTPAGQGVVVAGPRRVLWFSPSLKGTIQKVPAVALSILVGLSSHFYENTSWDVMSSPKRSSRANTASATADACSRVSARPLEAAAEAASPSASLARAWACA